MADVSRRVSLIFEADTSAAKNSINELVRSLQNIQSKPTDLVNTDSIKTASKAALELQEHLRKAVNVDTGKLDLSRFVTSLNSSKKTLEDYRIALNRIGPEGNRAFIQLAHNINNSETSTVRLNKTMQNFLNTLKNTVKWQISSNITHGLESTISHAYNYAKQLDGVLNDIRIVSGKSAEEMANFAVAANRSAQELSTTTSKYAEASLIFFQQGLSDAAVKERTDAVIKMASVTGEAMTDVSSYMTAIWNNFADGTKNLEYYSDVIVKLGADTASSSEEIAGGLEKFIAIGDQIGLSYEYAAAALTTITAQTRQSEDVVGTALRTIFARIQGLNLGETLDDGTTLNKYSSALQKVGVDIKDTSGQLKDMDIILDDLGSKWKLLSKDTQVALAQTVGGVRQYNQIIALMDNWEFFQKNLQTAYSSEGSLEKQYSIYEESWRAAEQRVKAAAEGIYDALLDEKVFIQLDGFFTKILNVVQGIVEGMGGMVPILATIGGFIATRFAKQVPVMLSNFKENFAIFRGKSGTKALQEQTALTSNIREKLLKATPGSEEAAELTSLERVSRMREELLRNQKNMNSAQIEEYENLIKVEQALGRINTERARGIEQSRLQAQETASLLEDEIDSINFTPNQDIIEKYEHEFFNKIREKMAEDAAKQINAGEKDDYKNKGTTVEERAIIATNRAYSDNRLRNYLLGRGNSKSNGRLNKMFGGKEGFQKELDTYVSKRGNLKNQINELTKYAQASAEASAEISKLTTLQNNLANNQDIDESKRLKVGIEGITQALKELQKTSDLTPAQSSFLGDLESEITGLDNIKSLDSLKNKIEEIINKIKTFRSALAPQAAGIQNELEYAIQAGGGDSSYVQELYNQIYNAAVRQAMYPVETGKDTPIEKPKTKASVSEAITAGTGALMEFYGTIQATQGAWETFSDDSANWAEKFGAALGTLTSAFMTFNGVMEAGQAITAVISGIHTKNALAKTADAVATKGLTQATDKHTASVVANNAALMANPIIAIIAVALTALSLILGAVTAAQEAHTEALRESAEASREVLETEREELDNKVKLAQNLENAIQLYEDSTESKESLKEAAEQVAEAYELENESLLLLQGNYEELLRLSKEVNVAQLRIAKEAAITNLEDEIALIEAEQSNLSFIQTETPPILDTTTSEVIDSNGTIGELMESSLEPQEQNFWYRLFGGTSPYDSNLLVEYNELNERSIPISIDYERKPESLSGKEGLTYEENREMYQNAGRVLMALEDDQSPESIALDNYVNGIDVGSLEYPYDSMSMIDYLVGAIYPNNLSEGDAFREAIATFLASNKEEYFSMAMDAWNAAANSPERDFTKEFLSVLVNNESSPLYGMKSYLEDFTEIEMGFLSDVFMIPWVEEKISTISSTRETAESILFPNSNPTASNVLDGDESQEDIISLLTEMEEINASIASAETSNESVTENEETKSDVVESMRGYFLKIPNEYLQDEANEWTEEEVVENYEKLINHDLQFYVDYIWHGFENISELLEHLSIVGEERERLLDSLKTMDINEETLIEDLPTIAEDYESDLIEEFQQAQLGSQIEQLSEISQIRKLYSEGLSLNEIKGEAENLGLKDYIDQWGRFNYDLYEFINGDIEETSTTLQEWSNAASERDDKIAILFDILTDANISEEVEDQITSFLNLMEVIYGEREAVLDAIKSGEIEWNEERTRFEVHPKDGEEIIYTSQGYFSNKYAPYGFDGITVTDSAIDSFGKEGDMIALNEDGTGFNVNLGEDPTALTYIRAYQQLAALKEDLAAKEGNEAIIEVIDKALEDFSQYGALADRLDEILLYIGGENSVYSGIDFNLERTLEGRQEYSSQRNERIEAIQRAVQQDIPEFSREEAEQLYTNAINTYGSSELQQQEQGIIARQQAAELMEGDPEANLRDLYGIEDEIFIGLRIFEGDSREDLDYQIEALQAQADANAIQVKIQSILEIPTEDIDLSNYEEVLEFFKEYGPELTELGYSPEEYLMMPEEEREDAINEALYGIDGQGGLYAQRQEANAIALESLTGSRAGEAIGFNSDGEEIYDSESEIGRLQGDLAALRERSAEVSSDSEAQLLDEEIAELEERIAELKNSAEELQSENAAIDFAQDNYASEAFKQEVTDLGFNTEEVEEYLEVLQETDQIVEDLSETEEKDLALALKRVNRGLKEAEESIEDYQKALKEMSKTSDEYETAYKGMEQIYNDLFDLDENTLSEEFITSAENAELLQGALKGIESDYDKLEELAAQDIFSRIEEGAVTLNGEDVKGDLLQLATEIANYDFGDLEIGASLEDTEFWDAISQMEIGSYEAAQKISDGLSAMGVSADIVEHRSETPPSTSEITASGAISIPAPDGTDMETEYADGKVTIYREGTEYVWYTLEGAKYKGGVGNKSSGRRGGGGGGRGGGGGSRAPRAERKTNKDKDRYRTVKNQLEDLTDTYDKVSTAADRAFGETKLELLKQQERAIQDLIAKQREYIDEINEYYDIDRQAVEEVSSRLGFAVEFDANGTITNWDKIQDKMIEEYNSHINDKGEVIGMDEDAWSEYEKEWERVMELFDQYDETQDLRKEALQQLQDYANQLYDLQLQEVTYVVEIKIDATDDALEILDYMLGRIEDDAWAAAEAIAYMGQKAAEIQLQNNTYTEGIRGILMNHTRDLVDSEGNIVNSASLTVEDVEGFMSGQEAAIKKIMALNEEFTDEEVQQLREYNSSLIEMNETLNDLRNEVFDKVLDSFEAFNDEMDRSIDKIDHLSSLTENYANIIDIVGQKNLEISNALMESISQATVDQATNRVEATREKMLTIQDEIARAEEALANARSQGLEEDVKLWEDTLKEMNDSLDEAEEEFLQSWEDALTAATDAFEASMDRAISAFSDALAGPLLGSLEQLEEMFDRQNTIADRYLPDYEKIYELNKLNRDITNSIDETDNIRAKQELAALQEEINKLEEDGVQVSEYQVENLRRRYELKLAELALTESQNAKSEVRMTRNADGDWSYVYVADEEQVAEAEQNYEDKLFAMQQANAEYINNLNDMLIQLRVNTFNSLQEIWEDETLSQEEKIAKTNELFAYAQEQMEYYMDELGLVLGENQILYEQDWAKYSELTGYKISANEDYVDHFNETTLSLLTGYETMEEFQQNFNDAIGHPDSGGFLYDLDNAFKTWEANTEEIFNSAGTSMEDFKDVVEDSVNDIVENSEEATESIEEMGDTVVSTFDEITSAVQNWSNVYSETIDSILARNEMLAKSFNELLKAWAGFEEATEVEEGTAPGEDEEVDTGDLEGGDGQTEEDKGKIQDGDAVYIAEGTPGIADWAEGPGRRYYAFYRNNAGKRAVGSGVWYVTVDPKNKKWDGYIGRIHEKYLRKFDTGGYTGSWGAEGRVAMLHEKELVLNKQDTSNLLAAVGMIRDISKIIDLNAYASSYGNITSTPNVVDNTGTLEQQVHITAEFPNATDKDEILSAFDDIINLASQYANRR